MGGSEPRGYPLSRGKGGNQSLSPPEMHPFKASVCSGRKGVAWVQTVSEDKAEGLLAEVYREDKERFGFLQNLTKALSLKPLVLLRLQEWKKSFILGGSSLGQRREDLINIVVSLVNRCHY